MHIQLRVSFPPRRSSDLSHVGTWRALHRRLKERLAGSNEWIEFDGTCELKAIVGGAANMDDNVFNMPGGDRKSTRLNSSHLGLSYAVFCLNKTNRERPDY